MLFEFWNSPSKSVKLNQEKNFPFYLLAITCGIIPPVWTPSSNSTFVLSCGNCLAAISLLDFFWIHSHLSDISSLLLMLLKANKSAASSRFLCAPLWFISLWIPCHVKLWGAEGVITCLKLPFFSESFSTKPICCEKFWLHFYVLLNIICLVNILIMIWSTARFWIASHL